MNELILEFSEGAVHASKLQASGPCKTFVIALTPQRNGARAVRLCSYNTSGGTDRRSKSTILEAACATLAAPVFFSSMSVKGVRFGHEATDWNNPTAEALAEAHKLWPSRVVGCLLSIRREYLAVMRDLPDTIQVHKYCLASLTSCEKIHQDVLEKYPPGIVAGTNYFRLGPSDDCESLTYEVESPGLDIAESISFEEGESLAKDKNRLAVSLLNALLGRTTGKGHLNSCSEAQNCS